MTVIHDLPLYSVYSGSEESVGDMLFANDDGWTSWIAGILAAIVSIAGSVYSIVRWIMPWFRRAWRAMTLADEMHNHFGNNSPKKILKLIDQINHSQGVTAAQIQVMSEFLDLGTYVCDSDGKCTATNKVLCRMFGLDSQQMLGHGWLAGLSQEDQVRVFEHWHQCVKNRLPYRESYTIVANGKRMRVKTYAAPVEVGGVLKCYIGWIVIPDSNGSQEE